MGTREAASAFGAEGKEPIKLPVNGWRPCTALFNGQHFPTWIHITNSGDRFIAPNLTPEGWPVREVLAQDP